MTPEEQAMLQRYIQFMMGGGNAPLASALGPAGGDDPNTNTYQDRMQILRDPFSATFAGPGGSDYGAFMPTIERTPVDNVGWLRAQQWGAAPIGSARRAIYDFVTLDGMDVGTAVQEVRKLIDQDPEGVGSISMSLPLDDLFNGELQPGTGLRKLEEQAYEMQAGLASSPAGAIPDGMGGYYTETEKPSALADKWRNEYALPLPTERYESDPATVLAGLQREGSGYMPGMDGFNPGLSADSAAMNRAMAALSDRPVTSRPANPPPRFDPPETPIEAAVRRNRATLGPVMIPYGDRINFDLADVIPFGVRNLKGVVDNARNAFGSSPEEASAGAPSSYDSVASQLAELGQFSGPRGAMPMGADTTNDWQLFGEEPVRNNTPPAPTPIGPPSAPTPIEPPSAPRGGSPIDTDPYDPLRGEDYEREKQRIADVLAARGEGQSGGGGKVVQGLARQAYLKADSLMGDGSTDQAARRAMERARGGNYSPETIDSWTNLLRGNTPKEGVFGLDTFVTTPDRVSSGPLEDSILGAYAGGRGQPRSYDPVVPRIDQERRDLQAQINQGVRDRRKIRLASDPGSRNAIDSAMNSGSNGGPLRLQPGQSFNTAAEASAGLSAYLKTPQSTPMMDAIRQRMLAQQLAGF